MRFASILSSLGLLAQAVSAKFVFAHVVVGDTAAHSQATWATDISLATECGIDAFVLNIGYPDANIPTQVANAFAAANAAGNSFKLFFSFDYLGGGQVWPATGSYSVVSMLQEYASNAAYFRYNSLPMVSTFEGVGNTVDWAYGGTIRSAFAVYFVPSWTSLGPGGLAAVENDIDGAFSWDMWPVGATNGTTATDLSWQSAAKAIGKTYMMGVSPWFFHSASGGTDWVWRGDDLWATRWADTVTLQPDFVQIVSWNDFAEAHYVGPIHSADEIAAGSSQYVLDNPHDSWRDFIPYYIAQYKGASFAITHDQMQYWYRRSPAAAGSACGVIGDASYQSYVDPNLIMEDGIFFSALLMSAAKVSVQIGSNTAVLFQGSEGINHWSIPFNGQTGIPTFSVIRDGATVKQNTGTAILAATELSSGCTNYNAWVGSF